MNMKGKPAPNVPSKPTNQPTSLVALGPEPYVVLVLSQLGSKKDQLK